MLKEYVPSDAVVVVAEAAPDKVIVTPAKGEGGVTPELVTVPDHMYVAGVDELEPAPHPANENTAKDANNKLNILNMITFIF